MQLLGTSRSDAASRPLTLDALLERYDPEVIDLLGEGARIRMVVDDVGEWDAVLTPFGESCLEAANGEPQAMICADEATWRRIARDVRGGMAAFRSGRLRLRRNLHLGVGFLAATSGGEEPRRLRFRSHHIDAGRISTAEAGEGPPVVCVHGLGGTKASFLPTLERLADSHRVIAVDLPGFGDSVKPLRARYDAPWFAERMIELLDELGIERAHFVGNSMGGRVALEVGLTAPERVDRLVLLSPAVAWLRDRGFKWLLQLPLPHLGLIQPTPRAIVEPLVRRLVPGGSDGWVAAGLDEFLRVYCTPAGRYAFYESARSIYMDEPDGDDGFWSRLGGLEADSMFVWGRQDTLVPIAFMKHVERALPRARHLELDCGHVPQLEAPARTHAEMLRFFAT